MDLAQHNMIVNFIWSIADDCLRDVYVRGKYRDVILPMTVIRRIDALLELTKQAVLKMKEQLDKAKVTNQHPALCQAAGQAFYNTSPFVLRDLKSRSSQQKLKADFESYLDGFSPNVQEILEKFKFRNQIPTMIESDILGLVIEKFTNTEINLSPNPVLDVNGDFRLPALDNHSMGVIFEELIRRFNEENNEEAGEHFTPRDVVKLMAKLIFLPVADKIESGTYLVYDGACGTGGMLTVAENTLFTGDAGQGESNIRRWIIENDWLEAIVALPENMFYNTGIATYIWLLSNRKSLERKGKVQLIDASGWFVPLRKNLGKKNCEFSEEQIRQIADLIVNPRETEQSKIFLNETFGCHKITVERPLKLKDIDPEKAYLPKEIKAFVTEGKADENGFPVIKKIHKSGKADPLHGLFARSIGGKKCVVEYEPDTNLRDTEQVPLLQEGGIEAFFKREVLPYVADAWIDGSKTQVGYEVSFTRYFYKPVQMRTLDEIMKDIRAIEKETDGLLNEIVGDGK
ncbi:MAG: hypothetical protein B6D34_11915 [Candidatus Brocadia sp. UTAMX1]|nr:MAG: hypothetical protein B6D34_11915 [Candidatus Brocadia sp. UTAMX1]